MATWKKLVVSGSAISQLTNDSGYISASQVPTGANGFASASYNGTVLIADSATGSLAFASGSGQGLTISANAGTDTLTFGLSAIPNTSLANSSSTIGTTNIQLGATVSTLDGLTSVTATNFTGTASFATNADLLDGFHAYEIVLNSQTSSMTVNSASYATVASSSLFATSASNSDLLDGLHATAFVLNSQTSSMTVLSASYASTASYVTTLNQNVIISGALDISISPYSSNLQIAGNGFGQTYLSTNGALVLNPGSGGVGMAGTNQYITAGYFVGQTAGTVLTGSLLGTSSYADNAGTALSSLSATSASFATTASYALNAPNAGNANTASNITPAITNEVDNRVLTANGGGTINGEANLTFDGSTLILNGSQTISGDLTVNGTTTSINTTNLNVADKFILLSSGSTSANDGGIIVQSTTEGTGFALLYDSAQARWAFTGSLSGLATSAAPDAFVATVLDLNVAESTDIAAYQKMGNIKIATNQDIFIWS